MKHLKRKLMMTLALLLTVATGAWADEPKVYDSGDVELSSLQVGDILMPGVKLTNGNPSLFEAYLRTDRFSIDGVIQIVGSRITSFPFSIGENGLINAQLAGNGQNKNCMPITEDGKTGNAWVVTFIDTPPYRPNYKGITLGGTIYPKPTPFAITWSAATPNTASIDKMPAGNVTVSVDYFAQAELAKSTGETPVALAPAAIANVPANTDAPIVTPGTVANIGTSEVPQGTLKYFVKQPTDNTPPTAPDYDDDGWSENVPTANELKQGDVYVWYYIEGAEPASIADRTDDNTRSDSDIKPLGSNGIVTLDAEPTYDVTLNDEGLSDEEAAAWKVAKGTDDPAAFPLEGVKKGETVTVTYSGTKKIIGVKAEKIKVAEGHALTSAKLGEIVCSDGKAYAAADKDILPKGVKAEALVCYVVGNGHGLALALTDEGEMDWSTAQTSCAAHTPAITGGTWKLASQGEWNNMINAAGGFGALRDGFSSVGGTNMQSDRYWSSSGDDDLGWDYNFSFGEWDDDNKTWSWYVRACLTF